MRSLNRLIWIQRAMIKARIAFNNRFWGMDIHPTVRLSRSCRLDRTYPRGVHIGAYTYVAFDAAILSHDMTRAKKVDTFVGSHCFIGARSLILPGVTIGDGSIVAAGSIVTTDVPPRCIVAGNPARVIREGISVDKYGVLLNRRSPSDKDGTEVGRGAQSAHLSSIARSR